MNKFLKLFSKNVLIMFGCLSISGFFFFGLSYIAQYIGFGYAVGLGIGLIALCFCALLAELEYHYGTD
jgi:uncharacterized oligopeptide transporter (OPT) family protein